MGKEFIIVENLTNTEELPTIYETKTSDTRPGVLSGLNPFNSKMFTNTDGFKEAYQIVKEIKDRIKTLTACINATEQIYEFKNITELLETSALLPLMRGLLVIDKFEEFSEYVKSGLTKSMEYKDYINVLFETLNKKKEKALDNIYTKKSIVDKFITLENNLHNNLLTTILEFIIVMFQIVLQNMKIAIFYDDIDKKKNEMPILFDMLLPNGWKMTKTEPNARVTFNKDKNGVIKTDKLSTVIGAIKSDEEKTFNNLNLTDLFNAYSVFIQKFSNLQPLVNSNTDSGDSGDNITTTMNPLFDNKKTGGYHRTKSNKKIRRKTKRRM
jgi:hypothetical protein